MRVISITAVAAAVVAATVAAAASGSAAAARCNRWVAPTGADTNPGTQASPFLTLGKLAASLAPGQTGCLAPARRSRSAR